MEKEPITPMQELLDIVRRVFARRYVVHVEGSLRIYS